MLLCQVFWLAQSNLPAKLNQSLDKKISFKIDWQMALCKPEYLAK